MKAASDGDAEEASYLFRIHSKMMIQPPVSKTTQPPNTDFSTHTVELTKDELEIDDEKPFVENGIMFMPGT